MTLSEVKAGATVIVTEINCEPESKRRLIDIGLIKGAKIRVIRAAPLGDPIEVTVRGYELSLRKADAEMIEVQ